MILVIDNYDSFTYNLVQYLGEIGEDIRVARNDAISIKDVEELNPSHIIISPGPGVPENAGITISLIRRFAPDIPILGVCLGHQAIGVAFGGKVIRADKLVHGKVSPVLHDGRGIFADIPSPFIATRYHSLVLEEPLPECLEVSARTPDGVLMGIRHKQFPVIGVQFHPESILTEVGRPLLRHFLEIERLRNRDDVQNVISDGAMTLKGAIAKVIARQNLNEYEAEAAMTQVMEGKATQAQIGSFLTALRMKGESIEEMVGCARAMRNSAIPVKPEFKGTLVDTCGTGGDCAGTFNISTTAAFVVAGAGQPVAKHGNRSISSKCGSADILSELGVNLDISPEQVADCIDKVGIGFLFAPKHHPAMKHAVGPRRELGVRTIFNLLGPLTNPAGAQVQILGVYDIEITETIAKVLSSLGSKAAFVVHGAGGLDELTTTGVNRVSELKNGKVNTYALDAESLGFRRARLPELLGGDAQENAALTRNILSGEDRSARRDVVLLNAAAALYASSLAASLEEGVSFAEKSIDSGSAYAVLHHLVEFTNAYEKIPAAA